MFEAIAFAGFALGIGDGFGEEARAMEIHVRVEMLLAEGVDPGGKALGDVRVTQVFTHDGAILGFRQRIVVAMARARLGELDAQLP